MAESNCFNALTTITAMFNGQVLFERKMMVRIDKVVDEKPVSKLPSKCRLR